MYGRCQAVALTLLGGLAMSTGAQVSFEQETLPSNGARYTLVLPASGEITITTPLVVSLHYGGPVSPWYGRGLLETVIEPALRPLGAMLVAPDCGSPAWSDCADTVDAVIRHLRQRFGLHEGCVALTGYSKGGIGTWSLAARWPARFSAAVVMAARVPPEVDLSAWRIPVRVIHGTGDELFPVAAARSAVDELRGRGVDADLQLLSGAAHYDTLQFTNALATHADWLAERCSR